MTVWQKELKEALKAYAGSFIGTDLKKINFDDMISVNSYRDEGIKHVVITVSEKFKISFLSDICEIDVEAEPYNVRWNGIKIALEITYSVIPDRPYFFIEATVNYNAKGKIESQVHVIDNFFKGSKERREHFKNFRNELLMQILKK